MSAIAIGLALFAISVECNVAGAATKQSAATVTAPTLKLVKSTCLDPAYDLVLQAYVYDAGYLFCDEADDYTGGQQIYKSNGAGGFTFIRGGGGMYGASDLVRLAGIPQAVATYLVNRMNSQLQAIQNGTQKPL